MMKTTLLKLFFLSLLITLSLFTKDSVYATASSPGEEPGMLNINFANGKGLYAPTFGAAEVSLNDLVVDEDGNIYVAGTALATAGDYTTADIIVAKFDSNGNLVTSFGSQSKGYEMYDVSTREDGANGIAISEDFQTIYVCGFARNASPKDADFALMTIDTNGNIIDQETKDINGRHDEDKATDCGVVYSGNVVVSGISLDSQTNSTSMPVAVYNELGHFLNVDVVNEAPTSLALSSIVTKGSRIFLAGMSKEPTSDGDSMIGVYDNRVSTLESVDNSQKSLVDGLADITTTADGNLLTGGVIGDINSVSIDGFMALYDPNFSVITRSELKMDNYKNTTVSSVAGDQTAYYALINAATPTQNKSSVSIAKLDKNLKPILEFATDGIAKELFVETRTNMLLNAKKMKLDSKGNVLFVGSIGSRGFIANMNNIENEDFVETPEVPEEPVDPETPPPAPDEGDEDPGQELTDEGGGCSLNSTSSVKLSWSVLLITLGFVGLVRRHQFVKIKK